MLNCCCKLVMVSYRNSSHLCLLDSIERVLIFTPFKIKVIKIIHDNNFVMKFQVHCAIT